MHFKLHFFFIDNTTLNLNAFYSTQFLLKGFTSNCIIHVKYLNNPCPNCGIYLDFEPFCQWIAVYADFCCWEKSLSLFFLIFFLFICNVYENQTSMTQTQCIHSVRSYFSAISEMESSYMPYMRKKLWTSSLIDNNLFVALQKHNMASIFNCRPYNRGEERKTRVIRLM